MNAAPKMALAHFGIYVEEIARMTDFYTRVLGFSVTDRAVIRGASLVFLSRDPDEHHQIVLVPGREAGSPSTINQISFRMVDLAELRRMHTLLRGQSAPGLSPVNHINAWSLYFLDPEGNRIELFVQTPWYAPPVSVPLDLSLDDDALQALTQAMAKDAPGHMQRTEWHARLRVRMTEEGTLEQRPAVHERNASDE